MLVVQLGPSAAATFFLFSLSLAITISESFAGGLYLTSQCCHNQSPLPGSERDSPQWSMVFVSRRLLWLKWFTLSTSLDGIKLPSVLSHTDLDIIGLVSGRTTLATRMDALFFLRQCLNWWMFFVYLLENTHHTISISSARSQYYNSDLVCGVLRGFSIFIYVGAVW